MIAQAFSNEIRRLDQAIEWAQAGLKKAPKGRLLTERQRGMYTRYFWRKDARDKKGTYLGKGDEATIKALGQKDYELRLLKAATAEKARLEKLLASYEKGSSGENDESCEAALAQVYDTLPADRKHLVNPYILPDQEYAQKWAQQEYVPNGHAFSMGGLFTSKGQRVRSKSEVIIANLLDESGVPYLYEKPLYLGGYSSVYPDFTVLNTRTREEYVWEHLGGMDDPDYCHKALEKLNDYALAGYLPGKNLLVTQESASVPLDTRVVSAIIQQYLK